ncbi:hypothetical protein SLEP1_g3805 [Rubroshorea leprosula]|uniref:Uncharacterized protein n=1 Tax=Rubroshorea leprosula TaxID=152421 RepID=A0AAV5HVH9_9ROSI|nr:hypothetical protein SLEP1_g3805 [Rubroshorea leprosula]
MKLTTRETSFSTLTGVLAPSLFPLCSSLSRHFASSDGLQSTKTRLAPTEETMEVRGPGEWRVDDDAEAKAELGGGDLVDGVVGEIVEEGIRSGGEGLVEGKSAVAEGR